MDLIKTGYGKPLAVGDIPQGRVFVDDHEKTAPGGMDFAAAEGAQIIDMHAHLWLGHHQEDACRLRAEAERYGVEKILISALSRYQPPKEEIRLLNEVAFDACEADPLFGAYVTVSPEHDNALEVLEQGLRRGAVGMKLWVSCLCDESYCDPLYVRCAREGIPVLVHTFAKANGQLPGEATGVHLRAAALRHPDTKFIMAHLGGNCYHGLPLVRDVPNVWADFSGTNCRADELPYALELLGEDRLLFGTDNCFAMCLGQVFAAGLTENQMKKLFAENARKLFPAMG